MKKIRRQLLFNLQRSQAAYNLYIKEKQYYQALRIYKANLKIYELLNQHSDKWKEEESADIIQYIFHLEDWFEQFQQASVSKAPQLTDEFVFTRLENSPSFPKNLIEIFKKEKR